MSRNLTAIILLAAVTLAQQINAATGQLHSDDRKAKVMGRIEEILDQWEKARPGSIGNLSQSQEDALANSLAKSLDPTASFQPADTAPIPTSDAQPISKPQPAVIIASQRVLYIRLDDISDTAADSIHADCESISPGLPFREPLKVAVPVLTSLVTRASTASLDKEAPA